MTQLEIEVKNRYGISRGDDTQETSGIDMQRASDFIDGYHQATEDIYEWLSENLGNYFAYRIDMFDMFLDDLKQAMKDET